MPYLFAVDTYDISGKWTHCCSFSHYMDSEYFFLYSIKYPSHWNKFIINVAQLNEIYILHDVKLLYYEPFWENWYTGCNIHEKY
jgi:hypothetical protein